MPNIIEDLREIFLVNEFNDFLKSINYDNKFEYNDINYEYFTIQWMSIWIKEIDFIMKNKNLWKNDFKKIIKCEKMDVKGYLIHHMLNDIIENNKEHEKMFRDIFFQRYKIYFEKIQKEVDLNKKDSNILIQIDNEDSNKTNKNELNNSQMDIEKIIDKIDIYKIYGIDDKNGKNNNKKRKFEEIIDNKTEFLQSNKSKNNINNNDINNIFTKKIVPKNITITIEKKNNKDNLDFFYNKSNQLKNKLNNIGNNNDIDKKRFLGFVKEDKKNKERSERYKRRMELLNKINNKIYNIKNLNKK